MKFIMDKLTSESAQEFNIKSRWTKIQVVFIAFCYIFLVYGVEFFISIEKNFRIVDILLIVRTVSKLIADTYCFVTFMLVLTYFIKRKVETNKLNE